MSGGPNSIGHKFLLITLELSSVLIMGNCFVQ